MSDSYLIKLSSCLASLLTIIINGVAIGMYSFLYVYTCMCVPIHVLHMWNFEGLNTLVPRPVYVGRGVHGGSCEPSCIINSFSLEKKLVTQGWLGMAALLCEPLFKTSGYGPGSSYNMYTVVL